MQERITENVISSAYANHITVSFKNQFLLFMLIKKTLSVVTLTVLVIADS